MSYQEGNEVTSTHRGSFMGWTPRYEHTDKRSYYERLRDTAQGDSRERRASTCVAGGWEDVIGGGGLNLQRVEEYLKEEAKGTHYGDRTLYSTPYGGSRSRPDYVHGVSHPGSPESASPSKVRLLRSITISAAEEANQSSNLPSRVIDDAAPQVHMASQPALGALEYSTSDLFGYFSHHELDWYHVVDSEEFQPQGQPVRVSSSAAARANSVAKLDALLHKLGLPHLCKKFRERGISFRGIVNMTPQHFKALGVSKNDRTQIISALRFAKKLEPVARETVLRMNGAGSSGINVGGAETSHGEPLVEETKNEDDRATELLLPLPLQRQRPRYMVTARRYDDYYRGPLFGQNAATFMGGRHNIKAGNGDAITNVFWAGTLRARPGSHHHCGHFERNYIRHEGVTLNSSHINPKLMHSSLPPRTTNFSPLGKHWSDGTPIDHPRRKTLHLIGQNAPWANVDKSLLAKDFD